MPDSLRQSPQAKLLVDASGASMLAPFCGAKIFRIATMSVPDRRRRNGADPEHGCGRRPRRIVIVTG